MTGSTGIMNITKNLCTAYRLKHFLFHNYSTKTKHAMNTISCKLFEHKNHTHFITKTICWNEHTIHILQTVYKERCDKIKY